MKLSMSTCGTERKLLPDGFEFAPVEGIGQCKEAGFDYIDFNFANAAADSRPMSRDDWKDWIAEIQQAVKDNGVTVSQTHAHWFHINQLLSEEELQWHDEMVRRSLWCSAQLGDRPWVVTHPRSIFDSEGYNAAKSREYNYRVYQGLGEYAEKYGVRIAVENLFANKNIGYCCCAEELMELMHRLNDSNFGICWDFGHANRSKVDHLKSLEIVAPHLQVTHCHDNKGRSDDHFMPYFGLVPWKDIMPKLKKIGYTGNLNMEVHVFYNTLPQSLRMDSLRYMRIIGENLIEMYDNA